jgi:hypothetical protein
MNIAIMKIQRAVGAILELAVQRFAGDVLGQCVFGILL